MNAWFSFFMVVAALLALGAVPAGAALDLDRLLERECRPLGVLPEVARGIIAVESGGHALALGVQIRGEHRSYYPKRLALARALLDLALAHTQNVGIGLMQINWRAWGDKLGVEPADLFDPALNVRTGCKILRGALKRHGVAQGIGVYHSPTPARQRAYRARVREAIARNTR